MVDALGDTGHSSFLTPEMLKAEHDFTRKCVFIASPDRAGDDGKPAGMHNYYER